MTLLAAALIASPSVAEDAGASLEEWQGWRWLALAIGLDRAEHEPSLEHYALWVEPRALRAAELLNPADASRADAWWFPIEVAHGGRFVDALAQRRDATEATGVRWTLRFPGRHGLDGVQSLTFTPADESAWAAEWIASEAARELGLLAAPSGFAAVSVNGGPPELAFWQEGIGATLLDRLRRAPGELVTTNAPSLSRDASRETRIVRRQLATLAALVEQPDDALFARRIPELLDVEKLLRWDALSWALGEPHRRAAPGWYFDSITGLLEPVLAGGGSTQLDATLLTARILRVPHYRARRDEVLRQLARTDGGLVARASTLVAGLARRVVPAQPLLDRLDSLRAFSRIDGELRARLLQRRRTLDRWLDQFEQRPMSENPAVALAAASKTRDRSTPVLDLRDTGLPLRVDGDRLILPAGTHRLQRTLVVPRSHRLVLEAGVELELGRRVSVIAFRGLEAIGTRAAPIRIRAARADERWGTIGVARAPEPSRIEHVDVSGGSGATWQGIEFRGQLAFNASDVAIEHSEITDAARGDGLSVRRARFRIAHSRFVDNASDGLDAEWSQGSVEHSVFANNGDDGLDLAATDARVDDTWFRRMGDKAISAGERSRLVLADSQLIESQIALASKDESSVEVIDSEFRRNAVGISLYNAKPSFGSARGVVRASLFSDNETDFAVEPGSDLALHEIERRSQTEDSERMVVEAKRSASAGLAPKR